MATALPKGLWKRGRTYWANFKHNGRHVRKKLSTSQRTAERMLVKLRERLDAGDFSLLGNDYPWDDLKKQFLAWARQTLRSHDDYERDLRLFEEFAKPANVREITTERMLAYRDARLSEDGDNGEKLSPRTVNRAVGTVKTLLNKGKAWGLVGHNPIADLKPLEETHHKKIRRSLSVAEVQRLFDASPQHLRPVWLCFMTTGMRAGELVGLRFSDIDFEGKVATVRAANAKGKKSREIPLDDETLATFATLQRAAPKRQPVAGNTPKQTTQQAVNLSREHVFVTQANTPHANNLLRKFYSCCKRAGIEGAERNGSVDIHSLRVSFVTLAIDAGASPKAVQAIVGHSTLQMTMGVYAKATDGSKRDAIGKLSFARVTTPAHIVRMHEGCTPGAQVESGSPQAAAG